MAKLQHTQKTMAVALTQKKCQVKYTDAILTNIGIFLGHSMAAKIKKPNRREAALFISTEGALRIPTCMTYDDYPIPSHPQSLFNHLNRPQIDIIRPPIN